MQRGLAVLVALTAVVVGAATVSAAAATAAAPLYRGIGLSGAPSPSVLQGLPAYAPSTMPTRYYDTTEYDVAPFVTPLRLPTPPPPPALLETGANAAGAAMGQAGNAESIRAAAALAAAQMAAAAQGGMPQQQMAVAAAPAVPRTPLMRYHQQLQQQMLRQQMPQQPMAAAAAAAPALAPGVSLLQAASSVRQFGTARAGVAHRHQRHNAAHHVSAQARQAAAQAAFERNAARMRFGHRHVDADEAADQDQEEEAEQEQEQEQADEQQTDADEAEESDDADAEEEEEAEAAPALLMETGARSQSRAALAATNRALAQQLATMRAQAAAWQRQRAAQAAYLAAPHTRERAAALAARPPQPFLADAPTSVAARGYVPHFAPLVRAAPAQQPFQPYASFFEAQAQAQQQTAAQVARRPQEPFLPRLPPPPIALAEY